MKTHYYQALNAKGEPCSGEIEADNEAAAIQVLRMQGLYPTQISPTPEKLGEFMLKTKPPEVFNRTASPTTAMLLALAILAGLAIIFCMRARQDENPTRRHQHGQTLIIDGKKYSVIITPQEYE